MRNDYACASADHRAGAARLLNAAECDVGEPERGGAGGVEGTDDAAVKTAFEKLQASQTKLGEAIYAQAGSPDGADSSTGAPAGDKAAGSDEDIVDAEIVDEDEKK